MRLRPDQAQVSVRSGAVSGRARLSVPGLRDQPGLAVRLQDRLGADERVHGVRPSTLTGNVLVLFDAGRLRLAELRRQVAREAAAYRPARAATSAARGATSLAPSDETAWHALPAAAALDALNQTPAAGLTEDEVVRRLAVAGPNRLPVPSAKSALQILWEQVGSLPMLLLGGAAVVSIATGGLVDGAAILAVIAINAAIGYTTESRVERILASLNEIGVPVAVVRRDERERVLPRVELVPGDIMVLRAGHDIPADGRLIAAAGLETDESALTGESAPVAKTTERLALAAIPIADRACMVYAGTVVADGAAEAVVTATGRRTELGRSRALVSEAQAPRTPLERQLDDAGRQLAYASIGLCGGLFAIGLLRGLPALAVFRTAASLAVAAVPEGLPTVATTTL